MSDRATPVAIIGFAYRAPGVGREGLWDFLVEGQSAWSRIPPERFDQDAFYHPNPQKAGCFSSQGGHFLPDDLYSFDATFFGMTAEEARSTDPQHRLTLECAFEACESAGLSLSRLAGSQTGAFVASDPSEYAALMAEDLPRTGNHTMVGSAPCMYANRLSHFFDLRGPSVSVDAACAGSSYALHLACQSLRAGECETALVGAAHVLVSPNQWSLLDTMGALSPEGKCFSYDTKASGFGRGEGAVCLVVKRLSDALECGDPVRSIIRNTAVSHSGRTQGITLPSRIAQEELLQRVHRECNLDPSDTTIVEGHGTGTQAGDPIDAGAIATVLASNRPPSNPICYLGSVKSNFGHLEGASGLLSVVKAVLMIEHGFLLPTASFDELNPNIKEREDLRVLTTTLPWPLEAPKRVLVTNYGFGGSNAAVIVENHDTFYDEHELEHTNQTMKDEDRSQTSESTSNQDEVGTLRVANAILAIHRAKSGNHANGRLEASTATNGSVGCVRRERLFVLSARSAVSLEKYRSALIAYLADAPASDDYSSDLSFTLGQRRTHFSHRHAVVAQTCDLLKDKLSSASAHTTKSSMITDTTITFVFTGQGAQYAKMATGLRGFESFENALRRAEAHLVALGASWSLKEELDRDHKTTRVDDAEIGQPACTAIQLALVVLLQSWGVAPSVVTGHSSGEIAAAFAADFISFEAAIAISFFRGQAAAQVVKEQRGAMLAVGASEEEATALLPRNPDYYATIAAVNGPGSVTISGDELSVEEVRIAAEAKGYFVRKLKINVAYHSRHMERAAGTYLASLISVCNSYPPQTHIGEDQIAFVSSVTGSIETKENIDAFYWVRNLVQTVRFADAIESVVNHTGAKGHKILVEIGPHAALRSPTNQVLNKLHHDAQTTYLPSLVRGSADETALLTLASKLFMMGLDLDLESINQTRHQHTHVLTDLPPYAWNKSRSYEHKSPISQQKLHSGHIYSDVVGWKGTSTGNEHMFRKVFNLDELSWVKDHVVEGHVLFPFTGYLTMAIDALRAVNRISPPSIIVREMHIRRGLVVQEDQRVDMTTQLRPEETGTQASSASSYTFEVLSWAEDGGWTTHCNGRIEVGLKELNLQSPTLLPATKVLASRNLDQRDPRGEYNTIARNGIAYGPSFSTMTALWHTAGIAIHETKLRPLSGLGLRDSPATVDAPTLDSFLHANNIVREEGEVRSVYVPTYIPELRISNHIPFHEGQIFSVVTRHLEQNNKAGQVRQAFAVFDSSSKPCFECEITFRRVAQPSDADRLRALPEGYFEDLTPHIDLVEGQAIAQALTDNGFDRRELQHRRELNDVGVRFLAHAFAPGTDDLSKLPQHFQKFLGWAKGRVDSLAPDRGQLRNVESIVADVSDRDAVGKLVCAVGQRLPAILRGQVAPLEFMLQDGMLSRYYEEDTATAQCSLALARFMDTVSQISPNMNILEIGAGTGTTTHHLLEAMSHDAEGTPAFSHYTFTDISSGFFDHARAKLARWSQRMSYRKLDISEDPVQQGFKAGSFDMVIAANVLHATPNIFATINHVHTLLKPKGRLALVEIIRDDDLAHLPFTLLPGWWLAEDDLRSGRGPLLNESEWNLLLASNGFTGVDGAIHDWPGAPEHSMTAMWSAKLDRDAAVTKDVRSIHITGALTTPAEMQFAEMLSNTLQHHLSVRCPIQPLGALNMAEKPFCIFVDSSSRSVLTDMSLSGFEVLQTILSQAAGVLWLSPATNPEGAMAQGLLRTLRQEDRNKNFMLLENTPYTSHSAATVARVAERLRLDDDAVRREQDFIWKSGMIHVPRLQRLPAINGTFAAEAGIAVEKKQMSFQGGDALEMTVDSLGDLDSVYFRRSDVLERALGDDDVLVKVEAAGMNFKDLLIVLGTVPWQPPGMEGAGTVIRVGSKVNDLCPGDRVFYLSDEHGFANYVRIHSQRAYPIPPGLSMVEAAGIPVVFSTALTVLIRVARLQRGETVLIHAASGATGQACVAVARHLGAEIFATAGTLEKREFLHQALGIPKTHIFSSRTSEFKDGILLATNGRGVDVVVNSLSGNLLADTWALMADFGRFVEIGKKDADQNSHLGMRPFLRNVTFSGVDMHALFTQRRHLLAESLMEISEFLRQRAIEPIRPVNEISISNIVSGLRKLQSGKNIGKIVITMTDGPVLRELPLLSQNRGLLLRSDATYVVTGGTGGIGRSLATWMFDNGAHNVILLGRSGASHPGVATLLKRYSGTKLRLRAIACEVSSREQVEGVVEAIRDLPRVRGVVHGAMYLRDSLFAGATFHDWKQITRPRVQAAWHLHDLFPDLDFFISLASVSGLVGIPGQSIYAATSSFLDAFTAHRRKLGLPAVSIRLPVIENAGYVADRGLSGHLKDHFGVWLSAAQLHTLMGKAIVDCSSDLHRDGKMLAFVRSEALPRLWNNANMLRAVTRTNPQVVDAADVESSDELANNTDQIGGDREILAQVIDALVGRILVITMMDADEVTPDRHVSEYGLDSLVSVELRNWIQRHFNVELAITQIVGARDIREIASAIVAKR